MARLLLLTPQIPYPPRQGTALRNWGLLRGLAAHHEVSLLTFAAPDQDTALPAPLLDCVARAEAIPQPERALRDRLRALLTTAEPDMAGRLASPAFDATLRAWLDAYAFDWVQAEGIEMAPYLNAVWERENPPRNANVRVAFDDHNCEYLLQQRACATDRRNPRRWIGAAYSAVQWRRLRRYEAEVCRRADLVIAVSAADARALQEIAPGVEPLVIPNGLAVAEYADFERATSLEQPALVFTGTMDFRPNVDGVLWFADQVWPIIRAALPQVHVYLVGRRPHKRLERLRDVPGIVITGSVPDTRPYIQAATVYIVPLLVGGGTRLKLLESSAMGKAIVSTTLGAEGFTAPGDAMLLADTPPAFAAACARLVQDAVARAQWEERARAFARAYDWAELLPPLLARLEG